MPHSSPSPRFGVAFLLTQIGSHAAERFAVALSDHDLTPPLAGIMRMLLVEPGLSQQQLAERLHAAPSRVVGYLDDLDARGWISRVRDTVDRRVNVLSLTDAGRAAFADLGVISRAHEARLTASLDDDEYAALRRLLEKVAAEQQLERGIHPGYREAGPGSGSERGPGSERAKRAAQLD